MKNISATQPVVLVAQNSGGGQHQGRPCPQAFILQEALAAPKNVCFRGVDKGFPFFKNPRSAQLFFLGGWLRVKTCPGFLVQERSASAHLSLEREEWYLRSYVVRGPLPTSPLVCLLLGLALGVVQRSPSNHKHEALGFAKVPKDLKVRTPNPAFLSIDIWRS